MTASGASSAGTTRPYRWSEPQSRYQSPRRYVGTVEVVSSAWMNRNGPPALADCHWFEDTTTCLWVGRMRYSGSSETPSCSEDDGWHGKFAAMAMSLSTCVCEPRNCCAVSSTGTRGGVKPNH